MRFTDVEKHIKNAFDQGEAKGLLKDGSRGSYEAATMRVAKFIRDYAENIGQQKLANPKHWKGSLVDKYFKQRLEQWREGEISADTIHKEAHAIEKFRVCVKQTSALGKDVEVRVGVIGSAKSGEGRLALLNKAGIIRSKAEITAIKATAAHCAAVRDHIPSADRNAETAKLVNRAQELTGSRITAMLRLKVGDIDLKNGTVTFEHDKNDFTHTTPVSVESLKSFFAPLVAGKPAGSPIFRVKDANGRDLNLEKARKTVETLTKKGADISGINRVNESGKKERFNTHSNRKCYAQSVYDGTKNWSYKKLEKEIGDYVNLQGSNKEQILQRMKNEHKRLNKYRIDNNLPVKRYTREQLRRLHVSLKLGHSRIDIVARNYIVTDQEKAKGRVNN